MRAVVRPVRAVVRDVRKGGEWATQACEAVAADINDARALTAALTAAEGVFVVVPPNFDRAPGFTETHFIAAVRAIHSDHVPAARLVHGIQRIIPGFLTPLDKPVPMVATADIGRLGANCCWKHGMVAGWLKPEGPHRVAPNDIATAFAELLARPVEMQAVPREQ